MTTPTHPADLLPKGLGAQVEAATGARITEVKPRGGGGASREGAELELAYADGRRRRAYMNYDVNKAGAGDDSAFLREAAILRALSGPLRDAGVRAAGFIAAIPESRALIGEFVEGESNFNKLETAEDRRAVARDFMAQLAALHSVDVRKVAIEGLGPVEPPSKLVRETLADLRKLTLSRAEPDPLVLLALDWLERNVPPDPERIVVVHGDAGPANFLYRDNRVTALLDWELVHYGDPMADLAMLCLRNLFQPFIPLPEAFAAYEAAGGVKVDLARVRFYRLYFQARFAGSTARLNDPDHPPPPVYGMSLVYGTTHLRVLCEALAEAAGVALEPIVLPAPPEGAHHRSFQIALDDLRTAIVPRLADQQASSKAKGLARLIKWWRDCERYGPAFDAMELAELSQALGPKALGQPFASVAEGRAALRQAVIAHAIDDAAAIQLCHKRTTRERALLADAMGALANSHFPPLE
jgi:aminoglycoside phosphotransferase